MRDNANIDLTPTPAQTAGPYFHLGCTTSHSAGCLAGPDAKGERVRLVCRVLDGDGIPVKDAMIELWQADSEGKFHHPGDSRSGSADLACRGFGRLATDQGGVCTFDTIKPGRVPWHNDTFQAPHFNVSVFARGILKRLATRIYFAHDSANAEDPVLALVPPERRATLMARSDSGNPGIFHFDVCLCGNYETVFFDV